MTTASSISVLRTDVCCQSRGGGKSYIGQEEHRSLTRDGTEGHMREREASDEFTYLLPKPTWHSDSTSLHVNASPVPKCDRSI